MPGTPIPPPHDVFIPTWIQAIGGIVMTVATAVLAWATFALVNATRVLADVGEKTWKSAVHPGIHVDVKLRGPISSPEEAKVRLKNACAVDLEDVRVSFSAAFGGIENGEPWISSDDERDPWYDIGSLQSDHYSDPIPFFELMRESVDIYNEKGTDTEGAFPILGVFLGAKHCITKHPYSQSVWYRIEDLSNGRYQLHKVNSTPTQLVPTD